MTAGGAPITTAVLGAGHAAAASGTYFIFIFAKAKKSPPGSFIVSSI